MSKLRLLDFAEGVFCLGDLHFQNASRRHKEYSIRSQGSRTCIEKEYSIRSQGSRTCIEKEMAMSECACSEEVWISSQSFFGAWSTTTLRIHEQSCENGLPVKPEIVSSLRALSGSHYDQRCALRALFGLKPRVGERWKAHEAIEARLFKKILAKLPSSIREGVRESENAPEPRPKLSVGAFRPRW